MAISAPSPEPHVFISGAPRSGTTLLKTVLVAHPTFGGGDYESTGLFRIRSLRDYRCGEIRPEQNRSLLAEAKTFTRYYDAVARTLLAYHGNSVFVDKVWPNRLRFAFVQRLFPRARWVVISRDGRDCFLSAQRHKSVVQGESLDRFAAYWAKCVRLTAALPATYRIRYEDLASDPEGSTRALYEALGAAGIAADLLQQRSTTAKSSIRKREEHRRLMQPITPDSVDRWRRELTPEQVARFGRIAGAELQQLGYPLD